MSIETMKQALEALDGLVKKTSGQAIYSFMETERRIAIQASVGLRQAIEQAEQAQPVAWFRYETVYEYRNQLARCTKDCIGAFPVYTSPPPRQPLTRSEINKLSGEAQIAFCMDKQPTYEVAFARAIEAAHGIKENT